MANKINLTPRMVVEVLPDSRKLKQNFKLPYKGITMFAPIGFEWNGASVPRIFWSVIAPFRGAKQVACMFHDYMYGKAHDYLKSSRNGRKVKVRVTRSQADDILLGVMKQYKVSWLKRYTIYWSVRLFGGSSWNK